ncbi:MAG: hypothetical protein WKG00_23460 [Polyangiaceae bacterium]
MSIAPAAQLPPEDRGRQGTPPGPRRRVWSEEVPYDVLATDRALGPLRRWGVELSVAVRPWHLPGLPALLRSARDAGVVVSLWPMLGDEDGRWANARNVAPYTALARRIVEALAAAGLPPAALHIDLEPPIAELRALLGAGRSSWLAAARSLAARSRAPGQGYAALAGELAARGVPTSAVVVPFVLGGGVWERLLGTPVDGAAWERVDVMLYTSIIEGWSRGWLTRADARAFLALCCRAALRRYGARAAVSLGAVGTGALGDEPIYRSIDELVDDVAIARAEGIEDLTLFDYGGVLARGDDWLRALVETPARQQPLVPTPRARAALWVMGGR